MATISNRVLHVPIPGTLAFQEVALVPGSVLEIQGGREPGNIQGKLLTSVPESGGTNQMQNKFT